MNYTKQVVLGAFFAGLAALLQLVPTFFSEVFVFITMLSAIPIYAISRLSPKIGFLAYLIAGFIVLSLSPHEALFFMFTNGPLGLALGVAHYYTPIKVLIVGLSALTLTLTLSLLTFILGVAVFGTPIPGAWWLKVLTILGFSSIYSIIYYLFANYLFKKTNLGQIFNLVNLQDDHKE
jgi:hypothetical protein